jgi:hypothetical protein
VKFSGKIPPAGVKFKNAQKSTVSAQIHPAPRHGERGGMPAAARIAGFRDHDRYRRASGSGWYKPVVETPSVFHPADAPICQNAAESPLLCGSAITITVGITDHLPYAGIWRFRHPVIIFARIARPLYVNLSSANAKLKVFQQPPAPAATANLILSFNQQSGSSRPQGPCCNRAPVVAAYSWKRISCCSREQQAEIQNHSGDAAWLDAYDQIKSRETHFSVAGVKVVAPHAKTDMAGRKQRAIS